MPTRKLIIERCLRQIYGGMPNDDSQVTINLVNSYLNDSVAVAAKTNYTDSIKIDGVAYINNSFYTSFKGLPIIADNTDNFLYKLTLPQVPIGIGRNEGLATLQFVKDGQVSITSIPLSINQVGYRSGMRKIPNKTVHWPEGDSVFIESVLPLFQYTGTVRMVSAGYSTDLNSIMHIPEDYMPIIIEYIKGQLAFERAQVVDNKNDGVDASKTI